jgi:hypothetical protein
MSPIGFASDGQCAATAVELMSFLWWAQFSKPALACIDVQRPEQGPNVDGANDLVNCQPMNYLRDLRFDERGDRSFGDVNEHHRLWLRCRVGVNEYASHTGQLLAMRFALTF